MKMKFISFNLRCCDDPDENSIAERAPRLKSVLSPLNADVIAFQEIRPKWVPEIERDYSDRYDIFLAYRSVEKPEGLITLWNKEKFVCLDKGHFWFSDTPNRESLGWDEKYHCPRICSYVQLTEKGSGESFLVLNTHFGFGDTCQTKSARMIKAFCNSFPNLCAIVGGDFNMNPSSLGYREMAEHFIDANAATVMDRRSTYHGYHPSPEQTSHIDYIFCDRRIVPQNFRIIDGAPDGKYPSDHFGIYSDLLL